MTYQEEIKALIEQLRHLALKAPDKAAKILSIWINLPTKISTKNNK